MNKDKINNLIAKLKAEAATMADMRYLELINNQIIGLELILNMPEKI
jgi:hypothetical protein